MAAFVSNQYERNPEATIYIGNIDLKVTPEIVWELFSQCGIVVNVHLPKEKIQIDHQGYGFVEFRSEEDADYAIKIMHMVKLYGKPIKVNKASQDKKTQEVGANLFVGNLDGEVDEKTLYDTFSSFGLILSTRVSRDPDSGQSKGYGFISYDNFESSDAAIQAMNGQFFYNKVISVTYAFKKDSKGERHGSAAERLLAANKPAQKQSSYPAMGGVPKEKSQQTLHMPEQLIPNIQLPMQPKQLPGLPMPPQGIQNIPMPPIPQQNMAPPGQMPPLPNFGLPQFPPVPPMPPGQVQQFPPIPPMPNLPVPPVNPNAQQQQPPYQ